MNVGQSFRLAIKSLLTSKARALLTMLGIIIGVAAVIVIVSLGTGMQTYMNSQFEQVGVNLIQVMVYEQPGNRNADADDFYELAEKYPQYIDSVTPALTISGVVRHGADEYERTSVTGVSETVYNPETSQTVNGEQMEDGRFLSYVDVERNQHVCVVGSYLNEAMFGGRGVGQSLTIGGVPFTVIGTMRETADSTEGSGDDFIYVPYGLAPQLNGTAGGSGMSGYLVASTSEDTSSAAKGVIESMLFRIYEDSSWYQVITMAEMMDMMDSMLGVLMTILIVIAAISLVVGGIGIMIPGRQGQGHPGPVHHRGGHHLRHRRGDRHPAGHPACQRVHRRGGDGHAHRRGLRRHPQRRGHPGVLRCERGHRRALRLPARQQGGQAQPHRRAQIRLKRRGASPRPTGAHSTGWADDIRVPEP